MGWLCCGRDEAYDSTYSSRTGYSYSGDRTDSAESRSSDGTVSSAGWAHSLDSDGYDGSTTSRGSTASSLARTASTTSSTSTTSRRRSTTSTASTATTTSTSTTTDGSTAATVDGSTRGRETRPYGDKSEPPPPQMSVTTRRFLWGAAVGGGLAALGLVLMVATSSLAWLAMVGVGAALLLAAVGRVLWLAARAGCAA